MEEMEIEWDVADVVPVVLLIKISGIVAGYMK